MKVHVKADRGLVWAPRRRGAIYCAPACGLGCRHAWYAAAVRNAACLAKHLGHGWKPEVHENLGWFARAVDATGRWRICVDLSKHSHGRVIRYHAFLGDPGSLGGRWAAHGTTPEAAMRAVRRQARAELKHLQSIVEGA